MFRTVVLYHYFSARSPGICFDTSHAPLPCWVYKILIRFYKRAPKRLELIRFSILKTHDNRSNSIPIKSYLGFAIVLIFFINTSAKTPRGLIFFRHKSLGFTCRESFHNSLVPRSSSIDTSRDFRALPHHIHIYVIICAYYVVDYLLHVRFGVASNFAGDTDNTMTPHYFDRSP